MKHSNVQIKFLSVLTALSILWVPCFETVSAVDVPASATQAKATEISEIVLAQKEGQLGSKEVTPAQVDDMPVAPKKKVSASFVAKCLGKTLAYSLALVAGGSVGFLIGVGAGNAIGNAIKGEDYPKGCHMGLAFPGACLGTLASVVFIGAIVPNGISELTKAVKEDKATRRAYEKAIKEYKKKIKLNKAQKVIVLV